MKLKIVTPERVVFESENIDAVYAQTVEGEIGILPRHIPMVTPLSVSALRFVQPGGEKQAVAVMGGLLRTDGQDVSVLSPAAELSQEIDVLRAEHARQQAEAKMHQQATNVDTEEARAALARSLVRIKVANLV